MSPDGLPSHRELADAPERAHLAMLRTAAALAARALVLEHPQLGDDFPPENIGEHPKLFIAALLLGRLDELAQLLDWYEDAIEQLVAPLQPHRHDLSF